ncbi:MAG: protein kinase, partial [Isosphaeraceae bacterium]
MARPDDCPGTERLAAWLAGSVPEDLAVHVEGCPACRQEVERRLSASEVLGGLTPGASDSQRRRGPALRNALDSLKRESLEVPDPTEQAPSVVGRSTVAGPSQSVRVPRPGDESSPRMTEVGPAKPDRRIGPYQVLDRVGRGGMGEVFRAMDPALDRVVAVKVLTESLAGSPEARRRFLREARAAAAVCHEHVVTIHAVDDSGDQPYLVMQYVAGDSLQEKIDRQGPLGLKEILRIGMQVASGLAAAHAQGLIHRDVKPANILLENGVERVKITDFGLARASSDPNLTRSGTIVGTPNYMSPEQARGESVSPRSDLFSLGGVLYAMATGEPPFVADSAMAVLRKVCEDPPRPIHEVNPEAPEWLVTLVDRLMAKQREGRPSSAEEVAEVLRRHLAELQSVPKVEPEPSRTNRRGKAIRTALALVLALVSVAAAGAVAVNLEFWTASSTPLPEPGPVAVSTLDSPTPEQADPFVEEGTEAARRNDHREAIDLFGKALQIDPGSVVARIGRGRAYGRLEDWSKALADLDQAIRQDPRNADAHEERAYLRTRSGDFSGAIADANVTLRLDPGRTHAYAHRGVALYGLDQWARSLSDLDT